MPVIRKVYNQIKSKLPKLPKICPSCKGSGMHLKKIQEGIIISIKCKECYFGRIK